MALRGVLHAANPLPLITRAAVPTEWKARWAEKPWTFRKPFGAGIIFFNFSTPVYKMLIIREPNTLEL